MSAVQEFQQSLSQADVESSVVSPERFVQELEDTIDEPAVGVSLPFEGLSLAECSVTVDPSTKELRQAVTGVTGSRLGIASLGTVAVESRSDGDELVALFPEQHVVVVREQDLRPDLASAFDWLEGEFDEGNRSFVFATGPSATGDMGALVQGVHGPDRVHVVVVTEDASDE